jgi:RNA polymerase sigma factor (sigma-70 family)
VQQEQDAEDITQEVFVTLFEKFSSFREEAKLSTWLYRITINKALDFEKKKKRKKNGGLLKKMLLGEEDDLPDFDHPGVQLDNKENAKLLVLCH